MKKGNGNNSRVVELLAVLIGVIVFTLLFNLMFKGFMEESERKDLSVTVGASDTTVDDRIDITATIQSIDPNKGELTYRLEFFPAGSYVMDDENTLTEDVRIVTNSSTKGEIYLKGDHIPGAQDITVSLFDGNLSMYPYDRHKAILELTAWTPNTTDEKGYETEVPLNVELTGNVSGLFVSAKKDKTCTDKYILLNLEIERAKTAKAVATFIIGMLWFMSGSVLLITYVVFFRGRKIEFNSFGWMATMLFAFFAFRNAAPGVPAIGSFMDYISFFWSEIIVATCLVSTVVLYVARPQGAPESKPETKPEPETAETKIEEKKPEEKIPEEDKPEKTEEAKPAA